MSILAIYGSEDQSEKQNASGPGPALQTLQQFGRMFCDAFVRTRSEDNVRTWQWRTALITYEHRWSVDERQWQPMESMFLRPRFSATSGVVIDRNVLPENVRSLMLL